MAVVTPADLRSQTFDPLVLSAEATRRLNGKACVCCGATTGLRDAGHAYTQSGSQGGRLGWAVRACGDCPATYEGKRA